jgi:hypothetical protein
MHAVIVLASVLALATALNVDMRGIVAQTCAPFGATAAYSPILPCHSDNCRAALADINAATDLRLLLVSKSLLTLLPFAYDVEAVCTLHARGWTVLDLDTTVMTPDVAADVLVALWANGVAMSNTLFMHSHRTILLLYAPNGYQVRFNDVLGEELCPVSCEPPRLHFHCHVTTAAGLRVERPRTAAAGEGLIRGSPCGTANVSSFSGRVRIWWHG